MSNKNILPHKNSLIKILTETLIFFMINLTIYAILTITITITSSFVILNFLKQFFVTKHNHLEGWEDFY